MNLMESQTNASEEKDFRIIIRTLVTSGFVLITVEHNPGYVLIHMYRYDEFGLKNNYTFLLCEGDNLDENLLSGAQISTKHHNSQLVIIGSNGPETPSIDWNTFIGIFGGSVYSINALEIEFGKQITDLGYNKVPAGLQGKADELLESYVNNAFEFIFGVRVIGYGQKRKFEAIPDGIILNHQNFTMLYDAKAYKNGYKITKDTIRQFTSYIHDFTKRYQSYLPPIRYFIVISGKFPHKKDTLKRRSDEFFSESGAQLVYVTCETLANIIVTLAEKSKVRKAINWTSVLSNN